jgi:predicted ribosomally synthesized peptide with SipW-like signal peptide
MNRGPLFSLLIIGAVVAIVGAAVSVAVWTDEDDATATVNSGIISLTVNSTDGSTTPVVLALDTNACGSTAQNEMQPGDTCDFEVIVNNAGDFPFDFTTSIDPDASNPTYDPGAVACFTTAWDPNAPDGNLAPGASTTAVDLVVTLDANAGDECQGESALFTVTFSATIDQTP